jgi:hypothetical protein
MPRRSRCGAIPACSPAAPGSSRSASARVSSIPTPVWRRRTPRSRLRKGYALVGTVDTVTRTLEKLRRRLPIEWVFCYTYNSLVPHDVLMKTIERFWTEVMPRVA